MVRVRFAPSPTGLLHIGSLRTALYNFIFARHEGGKFILRIEDTDVARTVPGALENILETLEWAGLSWDEGPFIKMSKVKGQMSIVEKGDKGPYVQSKRLDIYKKYAAELVEKGSAYPCFCTSERLERMRDEQTASKQPPMYDGLCRKLSSAEVLSEMSKGTPHVIRFKIPTEGETVVTDIIRDEIKFENKLVDDYVLLKSDGFPTYHLANVVDDHLMKITHVIRGEEWLPSTPKHVLLYKAFGWQTPEFAHLPLLLNPDRSKLSKRVGDVSVESYKKKGYLPEAIVNFIALLGGNPSASKEIYSLAELVKDFSLSKVNKGGAVVNFEKLSWLNSEYIRALDITTLTRACLPWLIESDFIKEDKTDHFIAPGLGGEVAWKYLEAVVGLEKDRLHLLSDIAVLSGLFFTQTLEYDAKLLFWKKMSKDDLISSLEQVRITLSGIKAGEWSKEKIESVLKEMISVNNMNTGDTLWPMRVALTGREASASPFEVAAVLGKERTEERINAAISKAGDQL